jgi:hypothetical protein
MFLSALQMSSIQQVLVSQLGDNMMHPVNRFLTADLDGKLQCFIETEDILLMNYQIVRAVVK